MSGISLLILAFFAVRMFQAYRHRGGEVSELGFRPEVREPDPLVTLRVGGAAENAMFDALAQGQLAPLEGVLTGHGIPPALQTFWVHHLATSSKLALINEFTAQVPPSGPAWATQALGYAHAAVEVDHREVADNCYDNGLIACGHAEALGAGDLTATARALLMVAREEHVQAAAYMLEHLGRTQDVISAVVFTRTLGAVAPKNALEFARALAHQSAPPSGLQAAIFVAHRMAVANDARNARSTLFAHAAELHAVREALQYWRPPSPVDVYVWSYVASVYVMLEDYDRAREALNVVADRIVIDAWETKTTDAMAAFSAARETFCYGHYPDDGEY